MYFLQKPASKCNIKETSDTSSFPCSADCGLLLALLENLIRSKDWTFSTMKGTGAAAKAQQQQFNLLTPAEGLQGPAPQLFSGWYSFVLWKLCSLWKLFFSYGSYFFVPVSAAIIHLCYILSSVFSNDKLPNVSVEKHLKYDTKINIKCKMDFSSILGRAWHIRNRFILLLLHQTELIV